MTTRPVPSFDDGLCFFCHGSFCMNINVCTKHDVKKMALMSGGKRGVNLGGECSAANKVTSATKSYTSNPAFHENEISKLYKSRCWGWAEGADLSMRTKFGETD